MRVLSELPTRSAIIDGEIVASDAAGMPHFWPLFLRSAKPAELHVWAFDLLALDGKDLRKLPLERRSDRAHPDACSPPPRARASRPPGAAPSRH
jgi:ATP-dependent DNA ligase